MRQELDQLLWTRWFILVEQIDVTASIVDEANTVNVDAHGAIGGCETGAKGKRRVAAKQNRANNQPDGGGISTPLASTLNGGNSTMSIIVVGNAKLSLEMIFDFLQSMTLNDGNGPM